MRRTRGRWLGLRGALLGSLLAVLGACGSREKPEAPPRNTDVVEVPIATSRVAVPVKASLAELEAHLNKAVPTTLYSIDRQEDVCVSPSGSRSASSTNGPARAMPARRCPARWAARTWP